MIYYQDTILTDSMERELLHRELDRYNRSFFPDLKLWLNNIMKRAGRRAAAFAANEARRLNCSREERCGISAAYYRINAI